MFTIFFLSSNILTVNLPQLNGYFSYSCYVQINLVGVTYFAICLTLGSCFLIITGQSKRFDVCLIASVVVVVLKIFLFSFPEVGNFYYLGLK